MMLLSRRVTFTKIILIIIILIMQVSKKRIDYLQHYMSKYRYLLVHLLVHKT